MDSKKTQTMFVGVVALHYHHYTIGSVDKGVPQFPQTCQGSRKIIDFMESLYP